MSTTFRFVDDQNKTARPIWQMVITEKDLNLLDNYNKKLAQPSQEVADAIAVVRQLPVKPAAATGSWASSVPMHVMAYHEAFSFKSRLTDANNTPITEAEMRQSVAQAKEVLKAAQVLMDLRQKDTNAPVGLVQSLPLKRAIKLQQKINDGAIRLVTVTAKNEFASNQSIALFAAARWGLGANGTFYEGYLTNQHMLRGLSDAKLFESEEAAELHIKKARLLERYGTIQMVRVNTSIQSLGKTLTGKASSSHMTSELHNSRIQEAVAFVQREQMEQALQEAGRERLEARLKELDALPDTPNATRKRM